MHGPSRHRSVCQLTSNFSPDASYRSRSEPVPSAIENTAIIDSQAPAPASHLQIATVGEASASEEPEYEGAATIGCRK